MNPLDINEIRSLKSLSKESTQIDTLCDLIWLVKTDLVECDGIRFLLRSNLCDMSYPRVSFECDGRKIDLKLWEQLLPLLKDYKLIKMRIENDDSNPNTIYSQVWQFSLPK